MNKKRLIVAAIALAALVAVAGSAVYAASPERAGQNRPNLDPEQRQEMREHHEAVKEAIASNDYATFAELTADKPMADKITAENFSQLVKMHQLMEDGDKEGARDIADELGLKGPRRGRRGFRQMVDRNGDGFCDYQDKE